MSAVVSQEHVDVARAVVAEWWAPAVDAYKEAGAEGFLVGLIAAALAGAAAEAAEAEFRLTQVKGLVLNHRPDAVPLVGLSELREALGMEDVPFTARDSYRQQWAP